jgi:hypothetical protein
MKKEKFLSDDKYIQGSCDLLNMKPEQRWSTLSLKIPVKNYTNNPPLQSLSQSPFQRKAVVSSSESKHLAKYHISSPSLWETSCSNYDDDEREMDGTIFSPIDEKC